MISGLRRLLGLCRVGAGLEGPGRKCLFARDLLGIGRRARPDGEHLAETVDWIRRAQDASPGDGIPAAFHLRENRWLEDYPETTGYTIRTFVDAYELTGDEDLLHRAVRMAGWESDLQLPSGAVFAGQVGTSDGSPAVFNTGQVILGWTRVHSVTGSGLWADSIGRAADWLCSVQDGDGAWRRGRSPLVVNNPSTYNVRCAWALAEAAGITSSERYMEAALRNADWSIAQQNDLGWFRQNDFRDNERPLLHTIAYTVRGILETGAAAGREDYLDSAELTARSLISVQEPGGRLAGRYDSRWSPVSTWSCPTGVAQTAVIWFRLFELGRGREFLGAARKSVAYLKTIHNTRTADSCLRGGVKGSQPVWGDYQAWMLPNWAAKFFADALILQVRHAGVSV